ncbi:MAG: hypothetical protein U0517_01155 [Candidatus Andersenbacteria bacterium]
MSQVVNILFSATVNITFVIAYAYTRSALLGTIYLLIIPTIGTITFIINRRIKASQAAIVRQLSELAGSTTETLRNVELALKSLGLEEQRWTASTTTTTPSSTLRSKRPA